LPLNIQAIIPQDQIKTAHLKALGVRIRYVEPETLQSLQPALKLLKRALVASRGG
jgi:mRNA-degrading endonuclease toxin of MazEF toxin-antitoxin module